MLVLEFKAYGKEQQYRANRKKSKKYRKGAKPQSKNYHKARVRYSRKHLRVSRQRKEYCKEQAYSVIQSSDLVAYVDAIAASRRIDWNVKGSVQNRHLAKSISDAGWICGRQRSSCSGQYLAKRASYRGAHGNVYAWGVRPSRFVGAILRAYGWVLNQESPSAYAVRRVKFVVVTEVSHARRKL
jgi:hypothetical protein